MKKNSFLGFPKYLLVQGSKLLEQHVLANFWRNAKLLPAFVHAVGIVLPRHLRICAELRKSDGWFLVPHCKIEGAKELVVLAGECSLVEQCLALGEYPERHAVSWPALKELKPRHTKVVEGVVVPAWVPLEGVQHVHGLDPCAELFVRQKGGIHDN